MDISSYHIFPKQVGVSYDDTFSEIRDDIVEYCEKQIDGSGNGRTMDGGYCLPAYGECPPDPLQQDLTKAVTYRRDMPHLERIKDQILQTAVFGMNTLAMDYVIRSMWLNHTSPKGYTMSHIHGNGCVLSGVYFIKIPDDSGLFYFEDESQEIIGLHRYHIEGHAEKHNMHSYLSRIPREGECLVFHPLLRHRVGPNMSNENRITIGFDIGLQYVH